MHLDAGVRVGELGLNPGRACAPRFTKDRSRIVAKDRPGSAGNGHLQQVSVVLQLERAVVLEDHIVVEPDVGSIRYLHGSPVPELVKRHAWGLKCERYRDLHVGQPHGRAGSHLEATAAIGLNAEHAAHPRAVQPGHHQERVVLDRGQAADL